ncbi:XPA-interacting protein, putative [Trypanosoma equiperdum]|uniref:GPN-loop GTPase n=2 Tax=Trypanozoon TaxID=39700 RepID=Q386F6_TRYB2|nr:XPA-interacting protein, putative [Trypanosoma brucei brucei TREU927]EAN79325.1 XPA-interacting protein, putative [Trypanosoma brucei brucei TREU927]SCU69469.1 XPA-interacting protein, putative [Trypanosoma equiperdum]
MSTKPKPLVILVVGMAGTGKTTLVHRLQHYAEEKGKKTYFINLDPAVADVPYGANIDIRDTVNYKEVIKQYRLGPNGAIMTSLNLFATKFHQVIGILEKKEGLEWIVVDTPGQIEVFTWSASGQIIAESLAATWPTTLLFVADTARCASTQTFMSTMLYASSIMLKQQLPLVLLFNKTDVVSSDAAVTWMKDPNALAEAVNSGTDGSYAGSLVQSLSLFTHGFYESIPFASASAASGKGIEELEEALVVAKEQYLRDRAPRVGEREKLANEDAIAAEDMIRAYREDRKKD